jgi:hypothetical protein
MSVLQIVLLVEIKEVNDNSEMTERVSNTEKLPDLKVPSSLSLRSPFVIWGFVGLEELPLHSPGRTPDLP